MIPIVLTRPAGRNAALAEAVAELFPGRTDVELVSLPLLRIRPADAEQQTDLKKTILGLTAEDWLIFVSPRAVAYADELQPLSSWTHGRVLAVGRATAKTLTERGLPEAELPLGSEDSEGLLSMLADEVPSLQGRRIWIVRGTHGREKLAQALSQAGAEVGFLPVYRRDCADWSEISGEQERLWGRETLWVITSPEALYCLAAKARQTGNSAWQQGLLNSSLVVINDRTEAVARTMGFVGRILPVGAPDDRALASGVCQLIDG